MDKRIENKNKIPDFLCQNTIKQLAKNILSKRDLKSRANKNNDFKVKTKNLESKSTENEFELPTVDRYVRADLKNNDYLKLYQNKNQMHDGDR